MTSNTLLIYGFSYLIFSSITENLMFRVKTLKFTSLDLLFV